MRGKFIFGVTIILVFAVAVFFMLQNMDDDLEEVNVVEVIEKDNEDVEEIVEEKKGNTYEIDIKNFAFIRSVTRVMPGDTVVWTNKDPADHSVVSKEGLFEQDLLATGESYSYTFEEVGRFSYNCRIHPYMKGTIIVYKE